MRILKRIKYNFITIMLLRTTSLVVIGAFLFTGLTWGQAAQDFYSLRPRAYADREMDKHPKGTSELRYKLT